MTWMDKTYSFSNCVLRSPGTVLEPKGLWPHYHPRRSGHHPAPSYLKHYTCLPTMAPTSRLSPRQSSVSLKSLLQVFFFPPLKNNLDSILKSRDITLPIKICLVKAMVFPVVMYGCERWTIKKTERRGNDAFELWCWRRLLRVPWTARKSNQSILKEISPEYSSKGLMLKLKLQNFGHLMWRTDSSEKTLMLGKIECRRRRGNTGWDGWMTWPTQWTWVWVNSENQWWTGRPGMLQSNVSQSRSRLSDWIELKK